MHQNEKLPISPVDRLIRADRLCGTDSVSEQQGVLDFELAEHLGQHLERFALVHVERAIGSRWGVRLAVSESRIGHGPGAGDRGEMSP